MRKLKSTVCAILCTLSGPVFAAPTSTPESQLAQNFSRPPASAQPLAWWHWMNGNITREGITADLESMKRVGIAGATIMNVANKAAVNIPAGPVDYLSPEWLDLMAYSAREAERLGLELGMANAAGWSGSGGPWITPENSMKKLVWSEVTVAAGTAPGIVLPKPKAERNFYRDIAMLAFPAATGKTVAWKDILDVSGKMDASGRLDWRPPAGRWTVLRFGYTSNGEENRPAPESGTGLECDKLSRSGLDAFWAGGIQPVLDKLGPLAGTVFNTILLDSYEAGAQDWTVEMGAEFLRRRGYDLKLYLPALAGRVINSSAETDRFQWDFKRTISDLFADNYYGYFADKCHAAGLLFACEPYGGRFFDTLAASDRTDILMGTFWVNRGIHKAPKVVASVAHARGRAIVGAEGFTAKPEESRWKNHPGSLKGLGDLMWTHGINRFSFHCFAHQPWSDLRPGMTMGQWGTHFGRNVTWWEQSPAWMTYLARSQYLLQQGRFCADVLIFTGETPVTLPAIGEELRPAGYDYDLCGTDLIAQLRVENGLVVQPSGMRYRMLELKDDRRMTPALAARVRELVQAGATVIAQRPTSSPSLANYPKCDAEVQAIAAEVWGAAADSAAGQRAFGKGRIVWGRTSLEVLKEMAIPPDFLAKESGKHLLYIHRQTGDSDIYFVSHQGKDTKSEECFFRVTGRQPELWNPMTGAMQPAGLWRADSQGTHVTLPLGPTSSLFVIFRQPTTKQASEFTAVREETPSDPQWLPEVAATPWGARLLAWANGRYMLKTSAGGEKSLTVDSLPPPITLNQPWTVDFTPGWGAPERIELPQLQDWTKNSNPGVKYYSGTGAYRAVVKLPADFRTKADCVELDLGEVSVLAEVIVNGQNLGVVWCKPFHVDITKAVKAGDNTLEIRVTNLWPNRLIGDEQYPADVQWAGRALKDWPDWVKNGTPRPPTSRVAFTTWHNWNKGETLLPSGLLGPVRLVFAQAVSLK